MDISVGKHGEYANIIRQQKIDIELANHIDERSYLNNVVQKKQEGTRRMWREVWKRNR